LHWDLKPQLGREVSTRDKGSVEEEEKAEQAVTMSRFVGGSDEQGNIRQRERLQTGRVGMVV